MTKKTVRDINVTGKTVLVRCDFNVPQDKAGQITDDRRIREALPTIKYLMENNARVILTSHLGRPDEKPEKKALYSLKVVADRLSELLAKPVMFCNDCVGETVQAELRNLKEGEVALLENVRYYTEEKKDALNFGKRLVETTGAEYFVMDAFGTAHRKDGSTWGVPQVIPGVMGLLVEKEMRIIGGTMAAPAKPFVGILGGAKIKDKIPVIENLIGKVDVLLIGGAMSYTFMKAQGGNIGKSMLQADYLEQVKAYLANDKTEIILPVDVKTVTEVTAGADIQVVEAGQIPEDREGIDIGPKTIALFESKIKNAKTVIWNGPMGVFEIADFAEGTNAIAKAVAESDCTSIIGGGDSGSAVEKAGYAEKVTHISTGGGASLELFAGKKLPAVEMLQNA